MIIMWGQWSNGIIWQKGFCAVGNFSFSLWESSGSAPQFLFLLHRKKHCANDEASPNFPSLPFPLAPTPEADSPRAVQVWTSHKLVALPQQLPQLWHFSCKTDDCSMDSQHQDLTRIAVLFWITLPVHQLLSQKHLI